MINFVMKVFLQNVKIVFPNQLNIIPQHLIMVQKKYKILSQENWEVKKFEQFDNLTMQTL